MRGQLGCALTVLEETRANPKALSDAALIVELSHFLHMKYIKRPAQNISCRLVGSYMHVLR